MKTLFGDKIIRIFYILKHATHMRCILYSERRGLSKKDVCLTNSVYHNRGCWLSTAEKKKHETKSRFGKILNISDWKWKPSNIWCVNFELWSEYTDTICIARYIHSNIYRYSELYTSIILMILNSPVWYGCITKTGIFNG